MRSYSDNSVSKEQFEALEKIALNAIGNQDYVKSKAKQAWIMSLMAVCASAITLGLMVSLIISQ